MLDQITEIVLPNIQILFSLDMEPGPARRLSWIVPYDDTSFMVFNATASVGHDDVFDAVIMTPDGKTWSQMSEEEHQDYPGDFEAQSSQGVKTLHSEEHLFDSDKGIVMLRRLHLKQIDAVKQGKDPIGVTFDESNATHTVRGGNFIVG